MKTFNRATSIITVTMALATLSIPISAFLKAPFTDPVRRATFTGPSIDTLRQNLFPRFTSNANGSSSPKGQAETFKSTFGVLFPAASGILAGVSMSGDLKKPSRRCDILASFF
jgi:potassium/chloride transporter 9